MDRRWIDTAVASPKTRAWTVRDLKDTTTCVSRTSPSHTFHPFTALTTSSHPLILLTPNPGERVESITADTGVSVLHAAPLFSSCTRSASDITVYGSDLLPSRYLLIMLCHSFLVHVQV
jgi:hypothetical protein